MSPAAHIIDKLGGVAKTAELTKRRKSVVYRWTYPKERGGTDGKIPSDVQQLLWGMSQRGEIDLTPEDFFPGGDA